MKVGSYHKIIFSAVLVALSWGVFTACKKSSDSTSAPTQGANEVWIQNMAFSPSTITVAVNTTVVWTNKDGSAHTVSSDSSLFDSGSMANGAAYSHQFTAAGTYPYHCSIHPGMKAKVVVN